VTGSLHGPSFGFTNRAALTGATNASFAPYIAAAEIYRCPAERTLLVVNGKKVEKVRSYSMNEVLYGRAEKAVAITSPVWPILCRRSGDLAQPANTFVFIEVEPVSICWAPFQVPVANAATLFNAPGAFHNRSGVLSFGDGRAESQRWKKPALNRVPVTTAAAHQVPTDPADSNWIRARAHHSLGGF
jgi:hypothetical protein